MNYLLVGKNVGGKLDLSKSTLPDGLPQAILPNYAFLKRFLSWLILNRSAG